MSHPSRRSFLAVTGAGAVTTAAVTASPTAGAATSSARPGAQPLVAHVRDAAAGTVVLYVGATEVVVQDHDLVRRLTRAARR